MQTVPKALADSMNSLMPEAVTLVITVGEFSTEDTQGATLSAAVGGGPAFSIGNAIPSKFEIKIDYSGDDLTGQPITVGWRTDESDTYPLFTGTVTSAETVGGITSVTAYDALYADDVYQPSAAVMAPCTGADALDDIAGALGVALGSSTKTAAQKITLIDGLSPLGDVTAAQAAGAVAALMGGNAIISRSGKLGVKKWADTGWTAEAMSGAGIAQTAPYTVTGLTFGRKRVDSSGPIPSETLEKFSAGNGGIELENSLATAELTRDAYNAIRIIPSFSPGAYTIAGGLLLEPGDVFDVLTASGTYRVYAAQVATMISGGCTAGVGCWGASADGRPVSPTAQAIKKINAAIAEFRQLTADYAKISNAEIQRLAIGAAAIEGTLDGLTTRVTATESTAKSAKEAIDALEVGGRNLIADSESVEAVRKVTTTNYLYEKTPIFTNTGYGVEQIRAGGMFTLSCDYQIKNITSEATATLGLRRASGAYGALVRFPLTVGDNSGHLLQSFTPTEEMREFGDMWLFSGLGVGKNAGAEVRFSKIKLEKGTIATDWTPAPEELESAISQTAEQIELTVKKADVISSINQTAEEVRIQADRIDLEGKVTAADLDVTGTFTGLKLSGTTGNFKEALSVWSQSGMVDGKVTIDTNGPNIVSWHDYQEDISSEEPSVSGHIERFLGKHTGRIVSEPDTIVLPRVFNTAIYNSPEIQAAIIHTPELRVMKLRGHEAELWSLEAEKADVGALSCTEVETGKFALSASETDESGVVKFSQGVTIGTRKPIGPSSFPETPYFEIDELRLYGDIFDGRARVSVTPGSITLLSGKDAQSTSVRILPGGVDINDFAVPRILSGTVTITPTAADTATGEDITFQTPFPEAPVVVATPQTGAPQLCSVSVTNVTAYGCRLILTRANTIGTTIHWIAMKG